MFNFRRKRERLEKPNEERLVQKFTRAENGGILTHVNGEKYPIRGNPSFLALKALRPLKGIIDRIITGRIAGLIPYNVDEKEWSEPVAEIARAFNLLIEAEKTKSNKKKWRDYKKVLCVFLEHDLPYRYKFQWLMEKMDMDKIKLTEGDKYFMRVKNFRVDLEDEWKEVLRKYPQLKGQKDKFKEFLETEDNYAHLEDALLKSLAELAPEFLKNEDKT